MVLSDAILLVAAALVVIASLAWFGTRHYRQRIDKLARELEEARAAAAHHALWAEEQRIELGRQVRALQTQVARLEALMQNEQKRANRGSWSLPMTAPGSTAAAAVPQMMAVVPSHAPTQPGVMPDSMIDEPGEAGAAGLPQGGWLAGGLGAGRDHGMIGSLDGGLGQGPDGGTNPGSHEEASEDELAAAQALAEIEEALRSQPRIDPEMIPRRSPAQVVSLMKTPPPDARWREPQVASSAGYYSSRGGRLTISTGGITSGADFDFAATQPLEGREARGTPS